MGIIRTKYVERRPLRAADLAADQAYHVAMRRRHNLGPHGWGIACGLGLTVAGDEIWLEPGMAVDGFGRELVVPARIPLLGRLEIFAASGAAPGTDARMSLWLVYELRPETPLAPGHATTGPGQHTRWREGAGLLVQRLEASEIPSPRVPPELIRDGVCAPDFAALPWPLSLGCSFPAYAEPPDDPGQPWPVYLGTATRELSGVGVPQYAYTLDLDDRPLVSLVGELVTSPTARTMRGPQAEAPVAATAHFAAARLQLGGEYAGGLYRLVVSTADAAGAFADRLAVDRVGNFHCFGPTAVGAPLIDLDALRRRIFDQDRPWPYLPEDLHDSAALAALIEGIVRNEDPLADLLRSWLRPETVRQAREHRRGAALDGALLQPLVSDLNRMLLTAAQYERLVGKLFAATAAWPFAEAQLQLRDPLVEQLRAVAELWGSADNADKQENARRKDPFEWFIYSGLSAAARKAVVEAKPLPELQAGQADRYPTEVFAQLVAEINALLAPPTAGRRRSKEQRRLFAQAAALALGGPGEHLAPEDWQPAGVKNGYGAGIIFAEALEPPVAARPWQIYRSEGEDDVSHGQLRVELNNPGKQGDPPRQQFVLGTGSPPPAPLGPGGEAGHDQPPATFAPALTVGADNTVTVHDNLRVEGQVVESPIDVNPDDPRFLARQAAQRQLEDIDVASLEVVLEDLIRDEQRGKIIATITLRNTSQARITDLELYETFVAAGYPEPFTTQILGPDIPAQIKAKDASDAFTREFKIPAGAVECQVLITAIGIAAGIRLVYAAKTAKYPPQT